MNICELKGRSLARGKTMRCRQFRGKEEAVQRLEITTRIKTTFNRRDGNVKM